ncbi:MAG TPA: LemA family protein [Pyrinomonadaceae bacterium]|nr:LemA family protein [Pyrinomonadaceae bacterium]
MNKRRMLLLVFVALVCVANTGCGYNTLQSKQQAIKARWSDVENLLQSRADLTPNLFEAAKAAGFQEQQVFGDIAAARSRLLNAKNAAPEGENGDKSPEQKQAVLEANNSFGGTIGRLLSLTEAYPQLRSNENFLQFQQTLEGTERRIAVARKDYNDTVQDYNTERGAFPTVLFAKLYGFKEEPYFKAEDGAKQVPRIDASTIRNQGNANSR